MKTIQAILLTIPLLMSMSVNGANTDSDQEQLIESVAESLNQFHRAAAAADWNTYFDLMSEDGVFIGTDVSERWGKSEFEIYARRTNGWLYTLKSRNITLTTTSDTAWFDEILTHSSYGTCRGTGVLIRTEQGWKIAQYHLTFPIPNALSSRITSEIKQFELVH